MGLHRKRFSKDTRPRNEAGFTLIEVLASLGLTLMLLMVFSQLLHTGVRIWKKTERAYLRQHQLNFIYQSLYNDISVLIYRSYLPEEAVNGDENQLIFWEETGTGLVKVKYRYDQGEKKVYRATSFWGGDFQETKLLDNVTAWRFAYYQTSTENWDQDWKSDQEKAVPAMIRITFNTEAFEMGTLTIPVKVSHGEVKDVFGFGS